MASPREIAKRQARRYFPSSPTDQRLFLRQMGAEAAFKDQNSPYAEGFAQFTPETARSVGLKDPHDPEQAYGAAAKLMRSYLDSYHGDWEKALTAYNAGPGRVGKPLYGETRAYLSRILGPGGARGAGKAQSGAGAAASAAGGTPLDTVELGQKASFDQAGFEQAQRRSLLAGFLSKGNPSSVLFKSGLLSTAAPNPADFTKSQLTSKIVPGSEVTSAGSGPDAVRKLFERAASIDREHLPYQWGGGHGAKPAGPGVPLDCSGAVSRVLGISPQVSGALTRYGEAGRGKHVTVYANGHHVLMEINGHFWGTSQTNPDGGAGWIKRSAISPQYLRGFVPRHPPGL